MAMFDVFKKNRLSLSQPIEVGTVSWLRELDDAKAQAASEGKPIFALFQEVPGCHGCKQFGSEVLSHPVIVDAIEEAFVPLLIHNNSGGRDAEVLAMYGEPAWNYQVVRFLDSAGADIIQRRDRVWDAGPLAARMIRTLEAADRPIPRYLRLLEQELSDRLDVIHLVQGCFWVGEMEIGQIEGVVMTEAGFLSGHEITSAWFDPLEISAGEVVAQARARGVASKVFTDDEAGKRRVAPLRDQKRQLGSKLNLRGLSVAQRTKLNAFIRQSRDEALSYIAPSSRNELRF